MKKYSAFAVVCFLLLSCEDLSSPPKAPSTTHLVLDSLGIWRSTDVDSLPFMDMPLAYRDFWRYCANCHSSSGQNSLARKAREALLLNTWDQIKAYGAEKLILAAKGGGMPLPPTPLVSDEVLDRAQAYLASWPDTVQPVRLTGFQYKEAESFVRKYCVNCHTSGGTSADQPKASLVLMLDHYEDWRKHQANIRQRLDLAGPDNLNPMPPPDSREDSLLAAVPAERARMIAWIDSLSPNNASGSGRGGLPAENIALKGLVYEPAFRIVNQYCADCHAAGGPNLRQLDGWTALPLDAYAGWKAVSKNVLLRRMDTVLAAQARLEQMPPRNFYAQPTRAERDTLLNWIQRGSPNTSNGQ